MAKLVLLLLLQALVEYPNAKRILEQQAKER